MQKNAHCSYCGHPFAPDQPWPRACAACGNLTYRNPTPVAVVLLPVDEGVLAIRRGIEPARGELALPGGFIDFGESWQAAGVRELFEETGIRIEPGELQEFLVRSTPDGRIVIVFGIASPRRQGDLPPFVPNEEILGWVILQEAVELAFSTHTEAVERFFKGKR